MKYALFFLVIVGITAQYSCKQVADDIVDCSVEALFVSISHENDTATQYKVDFTFNFDSSSGQTINNINWDFGDGHSQSASTSTISHTYSQAGSYTVKASYTINMDGGTCSSSHSKTINVSKK